MANLRNYLKALLREYWGEVAGGVVRDGASRDASRLGPLAPPKPNDEDDDPLDLDKKGVMVPDDAKKKIKQYFKDMKMEPTDRPGKTYK